MFPKKISHYEILGKLGGGGMGVVYKARDTRLDRVVALKFLPPHLSDNPVAKERFFQEARAASALDHRNICAVHDFGASDDGELFLVMAYYPGKTLRARLEEGPIPPAEVLDVGIQMADGLARAHEAGIVHRDVKPANVILTDRGEVKLLDFGLAKMPDRSLTATGSLMGTAAYMSPEQARGEKVDARTDIWSLGVVLYEALNGAPPFRAEENAALLRAIENENPAPLERAPAQLARIVERALQKERGSRYASMEPLLADLETARSELGWLHSSSGPTMVRGASTTELRRGRYKLLGLLGLAALSVFGYLFYERSARARWAREEALPEIERLADAMGWMRHGTYAWSAVDIAREAEDAIPGDPLLERLWRRIAGEVTVESEPSGADVFIKPYLSPEAEWVELGRTPVGGVRLPVGFSRLKVEKEGHRMVEDLVLIRNDESTWRFELPVAGSLPDEMVPFPAEAPTIHLAGLAHLQAEPLPPYLMDRYEVSNRDFKRFVDAGGYEKKEFWREPFVREARELSWEEALEFFKDKTGRRGPATWEVGDYPTGQEDFPVSGVSWYEAAAFALFAEKSLPTIFHWNQAARLFSAGEVVPLSNFSGTGPKAVGSSTAMNRRGTYDLAGNVREWCWNSTSKGNRRFILGGGWNDPTYAFSDMYAQSPWDRSTSNGFRCIRYATREDNLATLTRVVELPFRDYLSEEPASDDTFQLYLSQFTYDRTELAPVVESERDEKDWTRQKISFDAAYGGERLSSYLFLPKRGSPPYQAVILFPGGAAIRRRSSESSLEEETRLVHFLLRSGRALMYPVYKGTYERGDGLASDYPDETAFYKDHVIMWVKDFSRSVDYLETRDDIDSDKLAYFGFSWGGHMGATVPAVEKRIRATVLYVAGLNFQKALPEVDAIHYVTRVTQPVLMLNGEYDFFFPKETSQRPMFELLGTPEKDKRWRVYPGSHYVPREDLIRETLDWLDHYLGPVTPAH